MTKYIIAYLGGNKPASPKEAQQHMSEYRDWLSALGSSAISPANPLKNTHTLKADSVTPTSTTSMSGFTIIEAGSMEAALAIAKDCPFLNLGGTLEVSELVKMSN